MSKKRTHREADIKVTNTIIRRTDTEFSTLMGEDTMKDNGRIIRCMALENCIIKMVLLLIKVTGKMINLMVKVGSIIPNLFLSNSNLTTRIFLSLEIDGLITKDSSRMILNTGRDI